MAYRKKNSSLWYAAYREPGSGQSREKGFETRKEAEAWALEYRAKKKRGDKSIQPVVQSESTFRDLILRYLKEHKPKSGKNELYPINQVVIPAIGHITPHRVTTQHLVEVVNAFRENGNKDNTIKRRMNTVMAVLHWAEKKGIIERAPKFEMKTGDDELIFPPTREELKRILEHAEDHLRRAILLAEATGIRPGKQEMFSLTWDMVDWPEERIRVTSARKGGLPWRYIPIHSQFYPLLRQWYETDGKQGHIIHFKGKKIETSIKTAWNNAKRKAGITRRLRLYDLRHAFATELISQGVDAKTASYMTGHADVRTLLKTYRHVSGRDTRAAMELLKTSYTAEDKSTKKTENEDKYLQ